MPEPSLVRRRTAVLGVAATFLVAGCDHGDDIGGAPTPSGTTATGSPTSSTPPETPDEVLVNGVLASLTLAMSVLAPARKVPSLRGVVQPLLRAHRQHVTVLGGQPVESPDVPRASPATALRAVRRSEAQLQAALVDAAGKAESGALAKLLASISASVTQHLDALPKKA